MRYFLAAILALLFVACLAYFAFEFLNQPFEPPVEVNDEQLIIVAKNHTLMDDNQTCQNTRNGINELYNKEQTCKTSQECQLFYSTCSYRTLNHDNFVHYQKLRQLEDEVCQDRTIAVCPEPKMAEALCIKNTCQTVAKINLIEAVQSTLDEIKKAAK